MSVSRRDFLKGSALIMGGAVAGLAGAASAFGSEASGSASASASASAAASAASAASAEGGATVTLHRGYAAAHGDKCFTQVVVATADDGTVLAVNVDDYQFMDATTEGIVPVPNSDAKFGTNVAEGMVLGSKTDNNTSYSAHMAEKAGATQEWVVSMQAIEDYCLGKTPYELMKTAADGCTAKAEEEAAAAAASGSASTSGSAAAGSAAASAAASTSAAASAAPASAAASAAPASAAASAAASATASAAASGSAAASAAAPAEEEAPIVVDTITGATLEDRYSYIGAVARVARDGNIVAKGTFTGDGSDLMIGRTLAAAHGESAVCSAVSLVQGDTIIATSIDEFQFMDTLPVIVPVPNSNGAFGENFAEGKVLASKSVNSDVYSAHMEEKAGATTRWYDSMSAIEADLAGMTFEQAGGIDGPDAVSGATLEDTAGYAAAAVTAAQAAM